jgi:alkylation response protein AidB-like acyl-CoA dehydrogenase
MQVYDAPLRDMRFVLHELHGGLDALKSIPSASELGADLLDTILEESARFATEVLLPINASGDQEGCVLENGQVRTPKGFKEAYDTFRASGWTSLAGDPKYGGQGLPEVINKLVEEMICSANLAFSLYPGLTHGATRALMVHGTEEQRQQYVTKLNEGVWSGTMCLTEAHCGTDLGLLRTKATPQDDGSYRIDGSKIFISAGDHDLTENVIHLVLARIAGAPEGTRGISLFVVPKLLPDKDGRPTVANGVSCVGVEHKMGIKASATCQMAFENSQGWLVGEAQKGMAAMFTMMNTERVSVGTQGLGVAEAAYQAAVAYAKERLQGRSLSGTKFPDKPADPIIVHPDVRRMLMTMRTNVEGCRALGGWVAQALDLAEHSADPQIKAEAEDLVMLMTPIVKALFTDVGSENANLAVQVYGGHGFIREHGVEQYVRDVRITQIYEGTNGIQALDLIGRKLPDHMGRSLRRFFHPAAAFIEENRNHESVGELVQTFERSFQLLQLTTGTVAQQGLKDPEEAGAAATDYLRLFGLVALAFIWVKTAKLAAEKLPDAGDDAGFYDAKLKSARFFFDRILPQTMTCFMAIKTGKASMMALGADAF